MKNERGMALLLTIVMLFVLTSIVTHYALVYESEKRFMQLEKDWNSLDHLLITGMSEVLLLLDQKENGNLVAGKFHYYNGIVLYQITSTGNEQSIFLQAQLPSGRKRNVRFIRNSLNGDIIKWTEGANIS